jgi:transposase-like protein
MITLTKGVEMEKGESIETARKRIESVRADLDSLYVRDDLSTSEIADIFGVNPQTVSNWLRRLGFTLKPRGGRFGESNGRYKDGTEARPYLKIKVRRACENCGSTESLVVHHKNGDHFDNSVSNLSVLCRSCHTSLHKTLYWKGRKPRSIVVIRY